MEALIQDDIIHVIESKLIDRYQANTHRAEDGFSLQTNEKSQEMRHSYQLLN